MVKDLLIFNCGVMISCCFFYFIGAISAVDGLRIFVLNTTSTSGFCIAVRNRYTRKED